MPHLWIGRSRARRFNELAHLDFRRVRKIVIVAGPRLVLRDFRGLQPVAFNILEEAVARFDVGIHVAAVDAPGAIDGLGCGRSRRNRNQARRGEHNQFEFHSSDPSQKHTLIQYSGKPVQELIDERVCCLARGQAQPHKQTTEVLAFLKKTKWLGPEDLWDVVEKPAKDIAVAAGRALGAEYVFLSRVRDMTLTSRSTMIQQFGTTREGEEIQDRPQENRAERLATVPSVGPAQGFLH